MYQTVNEFTGVYQTVNSFTGLDFPWPLRGLPAEKVQPCAGLPDKELAPRRALSACPAICGAASLRKGRMATNLAQARRVRSLRRGGRCQLARRFERQPACARGSPSQGCGKMATSEAHNAATSQRTDVHAPLRGLAASLRKGVDRADEAVLY